MIFRFQKVVKEEPPVDTSICLEAFALWRMGRSTKIK